MGDNPIDEERLEMLFGKMKATEKIREILFVIANLYQLLIEIVTLIAFLADAALLVLTLIVEIPVLKNKDANNIC